jgi:signal transduction histidine kinase
VRTNVDLDTFVYTASHDLKAPITNIESILLALRDTLPPAVQQDELVNHLLGLLDTTVSRFQFTIGQLTDISRLQLAHSGPKEKIALAPVVAAVRLDLAPAIVAADTQLSVEVAPELVVSFSPANLRSIVYNLLSNAIKYRAPDRPARVWMRAEQTPTAVVLMVQDNGLGMSEVQQRQLFGLFQRLHTHVEGTGVGLYISKRLIENAGGTITVHSQPEVGTTFTVVFPR